MSIYRCPICSKTVVSEEKIKHPVHVFIKDCNRDEVYEAGGALLAVVQRYPDGYRICEGNMTLEESK